MCVEVKGQFTGIVWVLGSQLGELSLTTKPLPTETSYHSVCPPLILLSQVFLVTEVKEE